MAYGQDDLWLQATGRGRRVTPSVQQQWGLQPVQARPIDREQRGRNLRQLIDWRREQGQRQQRQQPQLASMLQQPLPQLGTFGTPQQPTAAAFRTPAPQPQQPKPKYDWQQPQMGIPTPEQRGGQPYEQPLLPGQPLPPTQQFGYRQPLAQRRQPLNQPYSYGQPQFGGLSQYFNY